MNLEPRIAAMVQAWRDIGQHEHAEALRRHMGAHQHAEAVKQLLESRE